MRFTRRFTLAAVGMAAVTGAALTATASALAAPGVHSAFIGHFHHTSKVASTVPRNGDVNPYGVVVVRRSQGRLHQGDILVSNFNNSKNLQGTGSTIVETGRPRPPHPDAYSSWTAAARFARSSAVMALTDRGTPLLSATAGPRRCSSPTS